MAMQGPICCPNPPALRWWQPSSKANLSTQDERDCPKCLCVLRYRYIHMNNALLLYKEKCYTDIFIVNWSIFYPYSLNAQLSSLPQCLLSTLYA